MRFIFPSHRARTILPRRRQGMAGRQTSATRRAANYMSFQVSGGFVSRRGDISLLPRCKRWHEYQMMRRYLSHAARISRGYTTAYEPKHDMPRRGELLDVIKRPLSLIDDSFRPNFSLSPREKFPRRVSISDCSKHASVAHRKSGRHYSAADGHTLLAHIGAGFDDLAD